MTRFRAAWVLPVSGSPLRDGWVEVDDGRIVDLGASVSVNGCCLTVVSEAGGTMAFDVIPQTLAVTSLGRLSVGDPVNLEHAATPTTFLGGHVVLGHVDGLAEVVEVRTAGEWRVRLLLAGELGGLAQPTVIRDSRTGQVLRA